VKKRKEVSMTTTIPLLTHLYTSLPPPLQVKAALGIREGLELATVTILLTAVLEVASLPSARGVWKQSGGPALYRKSLFFNFRNHYLYGVPVTAVAYTCFCLGDDDVEFTWLRFAVKTWAVVLFHAVAYYQVHKLFHTSAQLYQFHKFHHRYNAHVPPVSANAVETVEYLVAYVIPFAAAALVVRPTTSELKLAVAVISVFNLLVHTPRLEAAAAKLCPPWWVSTADHMEHHRRLTVHYASPTLNIDWIVTRCNAILFPDNKSMAAKALPSKLE
jgi:sterol desaturase/sphingolipid hydroxylase (fatty acid hydroxylase superfamily)